MASSGCSSTRQRLFQEPVDHAAKASASAPVTIRNAPGSLLMLDHIRSKARQHHLYILSPWGQHLGSPMPAAARILPESHHRPDAHKPSHQAAHLVVGPKANATITEPKKPTAKRARISSPSAFPHVPSSKLPDPNCMAALVEAEE